MEFIKNYRDIAEFVYFLSGPFMLAGLAIGILQLRHFKNEIRIRIDRESVLLSVSILEDKFKELSKLCSTAFNEDNHPDFPVYTGKVNSFHRDGLQGDEDFITQMKSDQHRNFDSAIGDCLCCLETLAQYINSGICDEQKCYELEGPLFVSYVNDFQEFIAFDREHANDKLYENMISLYHRWTSRLEHDNLLEKSNEINSRLKNNPRPSYLPIIGK